MAESPAPISAKEKASATIRQRYHIPYGPKLPGNDLPGSSFRGKTGRSTSHYSVPPSISQLPLELQLAQIRAESGRQASTRRFRDIKLSGLDDRQLGKVAKTRMPDQVRLSAFARFRNSILSTWPAALNTYWQGLAFGEKELAYIGWKKTVDEGRDALFIERLGQPNVLVLGVAPTIPQSVEKVKRQIAEVRPAVVAMGMTAPFQPVVCPPDQVDAWTSYPHTSWWGAASSFPTPDAIDSALHTKDPQLHSAVRWCLQKLANTAATVSVMVNFAWNGAEMQLAADMREAASASGLTDPLSVHDEIVAAARAVGATVVRASAPNVVMGARRRGLLSHIRPFESAGAPSWRWKGTSWPFLWDNPIDPSGDEADQAAIRAALMPRTGLGTFVSGRQEGASGVAVEDSSWRNPDDTRPTILVTDLQRVPSIAAAMANGGGLPFPDVCMKGERKISFYLRADKRVLPADFRGLMSDYIFLMFSSGVLLVWAKYAWRKGRIGKASAVLSVATPVWWMAAPAHKLVVSELDRGKWAKRTHTLPS